MKKVSAREVLNAVSMIPGIWLGYTLLTRFHCGLVFPITYMLFSCASMSHHFHSAFFYYNHVLLRFDLLLQQACAITVLCKEGELVRLMYVLFLAFMSMLIDLTKNKRFGYAINGIVMMIVADFYGSDVKLMCLTNILIFMYGNITRSIHAHAVFHLFAHYIIFNISRQLCLLR
jgi:hypothetical protein